MNAQSTAFRGPRPAVVVAPAGEGVRLAALVLALPMRLAASPLGRRLLAAVVLAALLVAAVGFLYDHADEPAVASFRAAGIAEDALAGDARRRTAAAPVRAKRASAPAEVAAAWFAAHQRVALDKVRALQQRRVSASETQVLVMAEAGGARLPSQYVTVRKGAGGWKVP